MKFINPIIAIIVVLFSSSCGNYVKKVTYHFNKGTTDYYEDDKGQKPIKNNPVVKEGSSVAVFVDDFNPLVYDVNGTLASPVLFFQTNSNITSSTFIGGTAASDFAPAKVGGNPPESLVKCSTLIRNELYKNAKKILDAAEMKERYENFMNSIFELNNAIELLKGSKTITKECLCAEMEKITNKIKSYYFDQSAGAKGECDATNLCPYSENAFEILNQKRKNIEFFKKSINEIENTKNYFSVDRAASIAAIIDTEKECITDEVKNIILNGVEISNNLLKNVIQLKDDFLEKNDAKMNEAINKYQSINFIEFEKKIGQFKVKETDEFKVTLAFTNTLINKSTTRDIELDVVKPLKIDFSSGVFYSSFYDERAKLISNASNTSFLLTKENTSDISYGAMGFINFHPVFFCTWLSAGASIGTGLLFNTASKFVFAPTASLFFGKYQRAIVHIGLGITQVERISSKYNFDRFTTDGTYRGEVVKDIDKKLLIGLSWNLSRSK